MRDPSREMFASPVRRWRCARISIGMWAAFWSTLNIFGTWEARSSYIFSDNGPNSWRWNGRMKGRKGSTDEGGVRVPCVVRWPEHISAGLKITENGAAIDLLPTLTDLASIPTGNSLPLDGISLKPLLLKTAEQLAKPFDFLALARSRQCPLVRLSS
ncbi:MAG: sulfatase-like hydrolase/transferase [Natrialbaceae archaeon]|nr:sulfatase-like hydrolase/transferase [Natrialbaceae archaeon]